MRTNVKFGPTRAERQEQNAITLKWGRGRVALPISFLRSSLFAVNRQPKEWDEKKEIRMESLEGIYVAAKGPRLDQFDRLVYCSILQLCWQCDVRNTEEQKYLKKAEFSFSIGQALRLLSGEPNRGSSGRAKAFHESLERLSAVVVSVFQKFPNKRRSVSYKGPLLTLKEIKRSPNSKGIGRKTVITVHLQNDLGNLFVDGARSELRWDVLRALGRHSLASWFYGFYATHTGKKIFYFNEDTLVNLMGLTAQNNRIVHAQFLRASNTLDATLRGVPAPKSFRTNIRFNTDESTGKKKYKYAMRISDDLRPCVRTAISADDMAAKDKEPKEQEFNIQGEGFDLNDDEITEEEF